jgi:UPF0716 protein FxsA
MRSLLLLLAYPLGEIAGFVLVGGWIGVLPTLGLVILSAVAGTWLLRRQAMSAGSDLRNAMRDIRGPVVTVAEGAMVSLGAILLILPGFLSDLAAIPLLVPPLRRSLIGLLSGRMTIVRGGLRGTGADDTDRRADATIIDGTFYEADPDAGPTGGADPGPAMPKVPPSGWTRH